MWPYNDVAERDRDARNFIAAIRRGDKSFFAWGLEKLTRLEVLNWSEPFADAVELGIVSSRYVEPAPSAVLSHELFLQLSNAPGTPGDYWAYVICQSHEERLLLADHLTKGNAIKIDGTNYRPSSLCFVDRTVAWDKGLQLSIGGKTEDDRETTSQLRPLIDELVRQAATK